MEAQAPQRKRRPWLVIGGSVVAVVAALVLATGGAALWTEASQRDDAGYFSANSHRYTTPTRAIATEPISVGGIHCDTHCDLPGWVMGKARLEVTSQKRVFVGIAPVETVDGYLAGDRNATAPDLHHDRNRDPHVPHGGNAVPARPPPQPFWAASATGSGTTSLTWNVKSGDWAIVVMNADGSPGVAASVSAGVQAPWLLWVAIGVTAFGALLLAGGVLMIVAGSGRGDGPAPSGAPVPAV
jgi:hypothetical protein